MKKKGFVLIELLVAILLFSLASTLLTVSFIQALKAKTKIEEDAKTYDPIRLAFIQLEKDLRNSIYLRDYPFTGREDEIKFPALLVEELKDGKKEKKFYLIHYYLKDRSLIRSKEELTPSLVKGDPKEKMLLKDIQSLKVQYPYEDQDRNQTFQSFWLTEPYYGIPRGVKLNLSTQKLSLEKMISIPQGRFAHMTGEKGM